jgi:DnaK suppressor protein
VSVSAAEGAAAATTQPVESVDHATRSRTSGGGLPRRGSSAPVPRQSGPGPYADDRAFLDEQRAALLEERATYQSQADSLRAEAESLALEREPGDVQFDEESGEGGTVAIDRERDLQLSAQAMAAIEEIDVALAAIESGRYGACEHCGEPIPKARLRALPFARLCVACKSGGLHRR